MWVGIGGVVLVVWAGRGRRSGVVVVVLVVVGVVVVIVKVDWGVVV